MKRIILITLLVMLALGAGFASVRLRPRQSFKPHTIVYRLISYDGSGKPFRTSVIIREVRSDGTWKHTQINPEGPPVHSNGKLKQHIESRATDGESPEHLGFKYIKQPCNNCEMWISPDLQDCLMFTTYLPDGSKESVLEAVNISMP